jgi:uncharacterized membrane protein
MKKQFILNLLFLLFILSPVFYLWMVWPSMPLQFSTRFDINGGFEKIQNRQTMLIATLTLSLVAALLYLLLRNLQKVDPMVKESTPKSAFRQLGLVMALFLVFINYALILAAKNGWIIGTSMALAFTGLFFACIGNYMNSIKPNYIAGFRLPWTLKDPDNWRKTHQLGGKLWFAGGILLMAVSFLLPEQLLIPVMIGLLVVMLIVPGIYSYQLYRKNLH